MPDVAAIGVGPVDAGVSVGAVETREEGGISLGLSLGIPLEYTAISIATIDSGLDVAAISAIGVRAVHTGVGVETVETTAVEEGGIGLRLRLSLPLEDAAISIATIDSGLHVAAISAIGVRAVHTGVGVGTVDTIAIEEGGISLGFSLSLPLEDTVSIATID